MKVIDQLVFFGELHGLAPEEARKRATDWAKRMEIADSLPKKPKSSPRACSRRSSSSAACCTTPA